MQDFILAKRSEIADLCHKHHVRRLSLFGSAVRNDFDPATSDIDLLVEFTFQEGVGYAKNFWALEDSMARLLGRNVDLVAEGSIKNPYILRRIQEQKEQLYAA
jgi:predicted nucleotidyltransferase